jgi:hypothetical protein
MIPERIVEGVWLQGPMDLYLVALTRYLEDRTSIREQLANQIELPVDAVKEVINALFAGAVISNNKDSDIYHILNGDRARIEFLKQNEFITALRADIKTVWEYIRPTLQKRTKKTSKGTERLLPITSKQKWGVYFEQERRVLDVVKQYLNENNFKYFLEHDGWSCDREIDRDQLVNFIREQTGFMIKIEHKKTTNI